MSVKSLNISSDKLAVSLQVYVPCAHLYKDYIQHISIQRVSRIYQLRSIQIYFLNHCQNAKNIVRAPIPPIPVRTSAIATEGIQDLRLLPGRFGLSALVTGWRFPVSLLVPGSAVLLGVSPRLGQDSRRWGVCGAGSDDTYPEPGRGTAQVLSFDRRTEEVEKISGQTCRAAWP